MTKKDAVQKSSASFFVLPYGHAALHAAGLLYKSGLLPLLRSLPQSSSEICDQKLHWSFCLHTKASHFRTSCFMFDFACRL